MVTYYDADESTGGLCVVPGSHRYHDELCSRAPGAKSKIDFVSISTEDPYLREQTGVLIRAKAGDLILWDSRTIHCNTHALNLHEYQSKKDHDKIDDNNDIIRLVSYVCMAPRSSCSAEVIESRKEAFITRTPTSHWPNIIIQSFFCDEADRRVIDEETSLEMLALVGYDMSQSVETRLSKNKCTVH